MNPRLSVQPQPLQNPHPPIWEPLNSERTIRWAAQKGVNGNFIFETDEALYICGPAYFLLLNNWVLRMPGSFKGVIGPHGCLEPGLRPVRID